MGHMIDLVTPSSQGWRTPGSWTRPRRRSNGLEQGGTTLPWDTTSAADRWLVILKRQRDSNTCPSSTCNGRIRSCHSYQIQMMFDICPNILKVSNVYHNFLQHATTAEMFGFSHFMEWLMHVDACWCQCKAFQQCETWSFLGGSLGKRLGLIGGTDLDHLELLLSSCAFQGHCRFRWKAGGGADAFAMGLWMLIWNTIFTSGCIGLGDSVVVSCCVCARHLAPNCTSYLSGADSERRPSANLCAVARSEAGHKTSKSKTWRSVSWL